MTDTVKDLIQEYLAKKGQNQKWLASQMGISEARLSYMLQGCVKNMKIRDLEKIGRALEMPLEIMMKEYF